MNCHSAQSQLSAYFDGELSASDKYAIRAHLNDCEACAEEAATIGVMRSLLKQMPICEPSDDLEEKLIRHVLRTPAKSAPFFTRSLAYVSGFAFAAAMFTGLVWLQQSRHQTTVVDLQTKNDVQFEVARDQAYFVGADPLSGSGAVIPANYGSR